MIFVFVALPAFMVIRTQFIFKKRAKSNLPEDDTINEEDATEIIITKGSKQVTKGFANTNQIIIAGINSFLKENRNKLLEAQKASLSLFKKAKKNKVIVNHFVIFCNFRVVSANHF